MTQETALSQGTPETLTYTVALDATRQLIARTLKQADPALADVTSHLAGEQGKNLRAALLLASSANHEGRIPTDAVTAAAALEILHLATLVHDDIIDEAPTRRGQPSVQSKFGKKTAVIGGDYLFCLCFTMLAGISAPYVDKYLSFARAMTSICVGELEQYKHNQDTNLSVTGYLRIIAGKTADLFTLAMYAGAVLSDAGEHEARLYGFIGHDIGMLFQLSDDCLDYEASSETLKKKSNHDLTEGVVTLPLIYSFLQSPALRERVGHWNLSATDVGDIIGEVLRLGGLNRSKDMAARYYGRALKRIARMKDQSRGRRIRSLLDRISHRSH